MGRTVKADTAQGGPIGSVWPLVRLAAGLLVVGVVVTEVTGETATSADSPNVLEQLGGYLAIGAGTVFGVLSIAVVAVGLSMTIFSALKSGARGLARLVSSAPPDVEAPPVAPPSTVIAPASPAPGPVPPLASQVARSSPPPDPEAFWSPVPVVGWRVWRWTGNELHGARMPWNGPWFQATCPRCPEVPGWDHTCGVYAVKEPADLTRMVRTVLQPLVVLGRVELTGLVVEHEAGYRAESGRIVELLVHPSIEALVAARYGGGVVVSRRSSLEGLWPDKFGLPPLTT